MSKNKGLINNADSPIVDATEQQVSALRAFLTLPVAERNALLAQQAATIAEYFVLGSEEMEWADEYVENDNWDDE